MKLLIAVINTRDLPRLREALLENAIRFTTISTTGGFLREGNATILIGVDDDQVETALDLIGQQCHAREKTIAVASHATDLFPPCVGLPITVTMGGAQVFILNVERTIHV